MNEVKKQWIVKRKYLLGGHSFRLLLLLNSGKYFFSNGEVGDFEEVSESSAIEMIERELAQ